MRERILIACFWIACAEILGGMIALAVTKL